MLEIGANGRQTGNSHPLASSSVPLVLGAKVETARATYHFSDNHCDHQTHPS